MVIHHYFPLQTDALEQKFDAHKYLSPQDRKKLAKVLSLSERQASPLISRSLPLSRHQKSALALYMKLRLVYIPVVTFTDKVVFRFPHYRLIGRFLV